MSPPTVRTRAVLCAACTLLVAACQLPVAPPPAPRPQPAPPPVVVAEPAPAPAPAPRPEPGTETLSAWEQLVWAAQADPAEHGDRLLRAAESFAVNGRPRIAIALLDALDRAWPAAGAEAAGRDALRAAALEREGRTEAARAVLDRLGETPGAEALAADTLAAQARLELAGDRTIEAARKLIRRDGLLVDPITQARNRMNIWRALLASDPEALREVRYSQADSVLSGWIDLATVFSGTTADPYQLRLAAEGWRSSYPGHPGHDLVPVVLAAPDSPEFTTETQTVALLLPLSSPFGQAARSVYDGFAAISEADTRPDRPQVTVYDVGDDPTHTPFYYRNAIADGATFIVGPLGRDAVENLTRGETLGVPTLLLGTPPAELELPDHVFSFGLDPEEEAADAARRAWADGHRRAAVLHPDDDWGERMLSAFVRTWGQLGGTLSESQSYPTDESDYSGPIKALFNINTAELRHRELTRVAATKIEWQARRRADVDFVFIAARPTHGRLLTPQITFFEGHDLPVYSTSRVYAGQADPVNDADLDGLRFSDMPWLVTDDAWVDGRRRQHSGRASSGVFDRLFAFGIDVYRLVPILARLRGEPYRQMTGLTADLSVGSAGKIEREPVWARFREGSPEPITAPDL